MSNNLKNVNQRSRVWGFLAYPESICPDWVEFLTDELNLVWCCSPLHDSDIDKDGKLKKPHYHCALVFDGKKSYSQIKEITDAICATNPQVINSLAGNIRYMLHLDDKSKAQYLASDLRAFNGFDASEYLFSEKSELKHRLDCIRAMRDFIDENGLTEFTEILDYAAKNEPDWFEMLCVNSTYVINAYLKSKRHQSLRRNL